MSVLSEGDDKQVMMMQYRVSREASVSMSNCEVAIVSYSFLFEEGSLVIVARSRSAREHGSRPRHRQGVTSYLPAKTQRSVRSLGW